MAPWVNAALRISTLANLQNIFGEGDGADLYEFLHEDEVLYAFSLLKSVSLIRQGLQSEEIPVPYSCIGDIYTKVGFLKSSLSQIPLIAKTFL